MDVERPDGEREARIERAKRLNRQIENLVEGAKDVPAKTPGDRPRGVRDLIHDRMRDLDKPKGKD